MTMKLITKRRACETLQASLSTLNRLLASGRIKSVKIGRCVRIPEHALDEFISHRMEAENVG